MRDPKKRREKAARIIHSAETPAQALDLYGLWLDGELLLAFGRVERTLRSRAVSGQTISLVRSALLQRPRNSASASPFDPLDGLRKIAEAARAHVYAVRREDAVACSETWEKLESLLFEQAKGRRRGRMA